MSDADLVELVRGGGESAAAAPAELERRHLDALRAFAVVCLNDPAQAEELAQRAWQRAASPGGITPGAVRPQVLALVLWAASGVAEAGHPALLDGDLAVWLAAQPQSQPSQEESSARGGVAFLHHGSVTARAFNSLSATLQTVLWHHLVERDDAERIARLLGSASPESQEVSVLIRRAHRDFYHAYEQIHQYGMADDCRRFHRVVMAYADGRGGNTGDVVGHLGTCGYCARAVADLERMHSDFGGLLVHALLPWGAPQYADSRRGEWTSTTVEIPVIGGEGDRPRGRRRGAARGMSATPEPQQSSTHQNQHQQNQQQRQHRQQPPEPYGTPPGWPEGWPAGWPDGSPAEPPAAAASMAPISYGTSTPDGSPDGLPEGLRELFPEGFQDTAPYGSPAGPPAAPRLTPPAPAAPPARTSSRDRMRGRRITQAAAVVGVCSAAMAFAYAQGLVPNLSELAGEVPSEKAPSTSQPRDPGPSESDRGTPSPSPSGSKGDDGKKPPPDEGRDREPSSPPPAPAVKGAALEWLFDGKDADGPVAKDSSGNGRNGTPKGDPLPKPLAGGGLVFAGQQSVTSRGPVLDTDRSFSVSARVKLNSTDEYQTVASQDGTEISSFQLQYDAVEKRWEMRMHRTDSKTSRADEAESDDAPRAGRWTSLTGVYDAGDERIRLYVDGELEGSVHRDGDNSTEGEFAVGRAQLGGGFIRGLDGTVSEIRAFPRALTGTEARRLAEDGDG
ncbi:LamG-like jellyroll fold domain-containing protein [Streptomyces sp. Amel2xB2]|uniref:LamG-like jellyroll fold domain-containing protein n=1 Tax=Streptomyces sp. Amel2xB2 TaxID=1305829 RepID=UPI0015EB9B40|nr:LamG-like jellyroll fold domain-containing protein [Streptomyces sp. Amel2xB2]